MQNYFVYAHSRMPYRYDSIGRTDTAGPYRQLLNWFSKQVLTDYPITIHYIVGGGAAIDLSKSLACAKLKSQKTVEKSQKTVDSS